MDTGTKKIKVGDPINTTLYVWDMNDLLQQLGEKLKKIQFEVIVNDGSNYDKENAEKVPKGFDWKVDIKMLWEDE